VQRHKSFPQTDRPCEPFPPLHAAGLPQRDNRYR
jgi:hypothetical protein